MAIRALRNLAGRLTLAVLAAATSLLVCAPQAGAQRAPFSTFQISKIISGSTLSPQDRKVLDQYFDGFFLPLFNKPGRPNDLPNLRNKIHKVVVKNAGKTPAHDYVNKKLLNAMVRIIKSPKASRAVKSNAMLLIADLNESDANRAIKPLPEAYRLLMLAYDAPPSWDYLKPAVLIGLTRFAEYGGIPPRDTAKVSQKMLKLLTDENPPAGRSASAHNFMRRRAAGALAAMGNTGPGDSVVNAFAAIAADPRTRPSLRCEMARFIGQLNYPPDTKVDLKRLANILGHQAVEVCQQQVDGGGENPDGAATRRMAMYAIDSCTDGLQKLSSSYDSDKFIFDLKRELDRVHRALDDTEKNNDDAVVDLVRQELDQIKTLLLEKPQPEPLAAADPQEEEATERASTN